MRVLEFLSKSTLSALIAVIPFQVALSAALPAGLGISHGADAPASDATGSDIAPQSCSHPKLGDWERVPVPGARCGDGGEYSVFVRPGDPNRVAVAFMGGGACWSKSTCFGLERRTYLSMIPFVPIVGGFVSEDPAYSPVAGWTAVYFPYCTGDLFAADHVARYGNREAHHVGRANVKLSFEHLVSMGKLAPQAVSDLVVWGPSAGALGAMIHARYLDEFFSVAKRKALIADAPGLHFGAGVWEKFPHKMIEEFTLSMKQAGLDLQPGQGVIAQVVPGLCRELPNWSVGAMQGSRDIIMSQLFGEITPEEHRQAILSRDGMLALTENPDDLCRSWVADTYVHTFLPTPVFAGVKAQGVSATEFMMKVVAREPGPNFADAFEK
jgi:hypothetical protein